MAFALLFALGHHYFFRLAPLHAKPATANGDGCYYYAYLVSLWEDHDLDFTNQYKSKDCRDIYFVGKTPLGRPANPFTIGPALLWSPFFAAGSVYARIEHRSDRTVKLDGRSDPYQHTTFYGTFLYAFAALLLAYRILCRRVRPGIACLASVGAFVGGSVLWYTLGQPSMSHALSAFLAALFFDLWDPLRRGGARPSLALAIGLGAIIGLAADVREADVALCLLPIVDAGARLLNDRRLRCALREAGLLALMAVVSLLAFAPQMVAWKHLYGHWLTIPQGPTFMRWREPLFLAPLFSTRFGLFPFAPLWWIAAIAGFPLWLAQRERAAVGALLVCVAIAYVNAAANDWMAGVSFGGRRYAELTVFAAIALGIALERVARAAEAHPRGAALTGLALGVTSMLAWNLALLKVWRTGWPDSSEGVDWSIVTGRTAEVLDHAVEGKVGNPLAWPASWWFALRFHTDPARWDTVVGTLLHQYFKQRVDLSSPHWDRLLARGFAKESAVWKPPHAPRKARGIGVRPLSGAPACVLIPTNQYGDVDVTVTAVALGHPGRMSTEWDGTPIGWIALGTTPRPTVLHVPRALVERGVNDLCMAMPRLDFFRPAVSLVEISGKRPPDP